MATHTDPGNPTPEEIEDQAWRCYRLRVEGKTIPEIVAATGLSRETVKRRLKHECLGEDLEPLQTARAIQAGRLDAVASTLLGHLGAPADGHEAARLAHAVVAVERRRASLLGLDEPSKRAVTVTTNGRKLDAEEAPVGEWLRAAVDAGEQLNRAEKLADDARGD